jgi:uncharacterized protein (TIGR02147 family)
VKVNFVKSIFQFKNYRDFLCYHYKVCKQNNPDYSFAHFARLAKLASPNHYKLVMDGDRNLSIQSIHQFSAGLNLLPSEKNYFESLVLWNQSEDEESKSFYEQRVREFGLPDPSGSARIDVQEILGDWYFPALVLSLKGLNRQQAVEVCAKRFGIEALKISSTLSALITKELINEDASGTLTPNFSHAIYRDKKSLNSIHKSYLGAQIQRSMNEFKTNYGSGPKFVSHTFTIPEGQFSMFSDRFYDLLQKFTQETESVEGDCIVQLNSQMFTIYKGGSDL